MGSTWGAAVIVAVVAIALITGFVVLWRKDKGRAEEVSSDTDRVGGGTPERPADPADTSTGGAGSYAREGAAHQPPESTQERRH